MFYISFLSCRGPVRASPYGVPLQSPEGSVLEGREAESQFSAPDGGWLQCERAERESLVSYAFLGFLRIWISFNRISAWI